MPEYMRNRRILWCFLALTLAVLALAALVGCRNIVKVPASGKAVVVQGKYAYLGVGSRLQIIDVSNPAAPVFVGEVRVSF